MNSVKVFTGVETGKFSTIPQIVELEKDEYTIFNSKQVKLNERKKEFRMLFITMIYEKLKRNTDAFQDTIQYKQVMRKLSNFIDGIDTKGINIGNLSTKTHADKKKLPQKMKRSIETNSPYHDAINRNDIDIQIHYCNKIDGVIYDPERDNGVSFSNTTFYVSAVTKYASHTTMLKQ